MVAPPIEQARACIGKGAECTEQAVNHDELAAVRTHTATLQSSDPQGVWSPTLPIELVLTPFWHQLHWSRTPTPGFFLHLFVSIPHGKFQCAGGGGSFEQNGVGPR
eukprot:gene8272-biopygen12126